MDFDSDFWGFEIGRVDHAPGDFDFDSEWRLVAATDHQTIHGLEQIEFRFMDFRVEYARDTGPEVGISRPAGDDDLEQLAAIARTAFRGLTRFYADPHFPDDRCGDLYAGWFYENYDDPNVEILIVGDGSGPVGFVTVELKTAEASIVLIAVAERARGHGMGANLTRAAVNHAHEAGIPSISVVTQGCNIPSQRAFQAAGFRIRSSSVWLHRWRGQ